MKLKSPTLLATKTAEFFSFLYQLISLGQNIHVLESELTCIKKSWGTDIEGYFEVSSKKSALSGGLQSALNLRKPKDV